MKTYDIVGYDANLNQVTVGKGHVFVSYGRRLYITLQFMCSYMFNTDPSFAKQRITATVWNDMTTRFASYVDVLYAPGCVYVAC